MIKFEILASVDFRIGGGSPNRTCIHCHIHILMAQEEHAASRLHKHDEGNADEVHCSRERSRTAWKIIEEYLMPFVEQEKYQLSLNCRLPPDNDIFRDQELHKIHVDINE